MSGNKGREEGNDGWDEEEFHYEVGGACRDGRSKGGRRRARATVSYSWDIGGHRDTSFIASVRIGMGRTALKTASRMSLDGMTQKCDMLSSSILLRLGAHIQ